ncbi:hypothetical protein As57867_006854, partial [Aphanomyces stellatus]
MPSMKRKTPTAPCCDIDVMNVFKSKDTFAKALAAAPSVQVKKEKRVQFISDPSQVAYCHERFRDAVIIGLDTETKPEFQRGAPQNKTSLLQIATRDAAGKEEVFIFDLLALKPIHYNKMLSDVFLAPHVLKMGQSLMGDLKELHAAYPRASCFREIRGALEANDLF